MATIASSIAVSFSGVGVVVNRVSIVAESDSPGGAGPVRSVNTPTIAGRRLGSAKPVRSSLPAWSPDLVSPTNVAKVPVVREVISMREQPAAATTGPRHAGDHDVAVGDVDALAGDVDEQRVERGLLAVWRRGAQHQPARRRHRRGPPRTARWRSVDTGVSEISGAVTLLS